MKRLPKIVCLLPLVFLISCVLGTKNIHVNTNGMEVELVKELSVPFSEHGNIPSDGRFFLTGGRFENVFKWWDTLKGEQIGTFHVRRDRQSLAQAIISPDHRYLLSSGENLVLWDLSKGRELKNLDKTTAPLFISNFSSDGLNVASFAEDIQFFIESRYYLSVWNAATWKRRSEARKKLSDFDFPRALALSPDSRHILLGTSGNFTGNVILMESGRGGAVKKAPASEGFLQAFVTSVAFSPDGSQALSGGLDDTVRVWEIPSMKELKKIDAHTAGESQKGVLSVTFSPDGKYLLTGGADGLLKMWEASSGQEKRRFNAFPGDPKTVVRQGVGSAAFLPGGKRIISTYADGVVRIWDTDTGKEVAFIFGFADGEWLVMTPEGYYHSSEKGAQSLKVTVDKNEYTLDQFYDLFYRPDIVSARLSGQDLRESAMKDIPKSPPPVIESIKGLPGIDTSRANVCCKIRDAGGGIGEVRLYLNGKLVQSGDFFSKFAPAPLPEKNISAAQPKGRAFETCREIETIRGANEVSVTAFNGSNSIQSELKSARFKSKTKAEDPRLYILALGIDRYQDPSLNLKYAAKDASDLGSRLRTQAAALFKPQNIHYELLTNDKASRAAILKTIDSLAQAIQPQDCFILFISGYGSLRQNQFDMLAYDHSGPLNKEGTISSDEIEEISRKIKSFSQLYIFETCLAGGIDRTLSGLYNARMSVLARKMGLHVYAFAVDQQASLRGYGDNGLLTHVLLEGLGNQKEAVRSKDRKVTMESLGAYVKKATAGLPGERDRDERPLIINFGRDNAIGKQ